MKFTFASFALAVGLMAGAPVRAQDWNYSASIYVFVAETKTGIGDRSATLSFSDALDNLDATFMGALSADNGQWGFLIDYMMTDVSFGNTTPGTAFGGLNTSVKTRIMTGYLSYRLYETDTVRTDLLAGARWFDTDTTLTLLPGTAPGNSRSLSDDWVDPVIGLRSQFSLSDRWASTVAFDYGGVNDRDTWQVLFTADYAFNANWVGRIGYRHISVSNDEPANAYSFEQSGPIFGVTYRF